ncbi:MAG TPA: malto-oligosyltrehalose synthase [Candidatus Binataceae bacterium]
MSREPLSTYRVQLNQEFDFDAATRIISYLDELGIDQLYCSPYFQAAPGSTHGYDVVDHSRASEDLGGAEGHARLCEELKRHRMGQVLDIVPNHMAITGRENPWWWDVLENGPSSTFAAFFDVDWEPPETRHRNSVLLPVLEDQYGRVLEAGKLKVIREEGRFVVCYGDKVFPVAPRSLREVLAAAAAPCRSEALAFIADAYGELPAPAATDTKSITRRHRDKRVLNVMLDRLVREEPAVGAAIDKVLAELNSDHNRLYEFLEHQNFRLAYWRMATRDLGYRRFFDINSLVGLRMENDSVFDATHALVLKWIRENKLNGLRVDHPDGLRDPLAYFERLRAAAPDCWIVAEKILARQESLRDSWPIDGTSGYDFLNLAAGLFVDPSGAEPLDAFYREFTGESVDYASVVRAKKQIAMRESLGSDINYLTALFLDICESERFHRDYTRHEVHEVLRAALACFQVYRTYVRTPGEVVPEDEREIAAAIEQAKAYRQDLDSRLFDFLGDILTLRVPGDLPLELAMRFQQTDAAVTAKGAEDTAFYTFNRMIALNEVGGDPGSFGIAPEEFYRWSRNIHRKWPRTMLTTSTHDTKRSEDVRARLFLLSEIPDQWSRAVRDWFAINERYRKGDLPDRNIEYHLYQVLVGAWPLDRARLWSYAEKAAREAKVYTSWTNPEPNYEAGFKQFVEGILDDRRFVKELEEFVAPLIAPGRINSLAQTLLKLAAPGVPDFYQGTELWNLALVDPDNRRPVDYDTRRKLLADLRTATPEQVMARIDEGLPKLWLIKQALALRKRHPEWFGPDAGIHPLTASGARAEHVIAFARGTSVVAIAPRLVIKLGGDWQDTKLTLPEGEWINHLTGEHWHGTSVRLGDLLRRFPVGLLSQPEAAR